MILLHDLRLPLTAPPEEAFAAACGRLGLAAVHIAGCHIHKISVDARKTPPRLVYSVALALENEALERQAVQKAGGESARLRLAAPARVAAKPGAAPLPGPVVVCGMGPAGLFAALGLAKAGYRPTLLERGPAMEQRRAAVNAFAAGGPLAPEANIQFGEGGAGAFSDGKLTTRIHDPLCEEVTQSLLGAGAPADIAYRAAPHVGTDKLQTVIPKLRDEILARGARVLYNTRLLSLVHKNGRLAGVETSAGPLACGALVLAVGHSARDTFETLYGAGVPMEPKPFSVGFRIEHLQSEIDKGLYHGAAGHPALPPGEYRLSARVAGRGVYSFCMCPGGSVVAAASEAEHQVTNGMSAHSRSGKNANAAVVAGVDARDFGAGALDGLAFQRRLEHAAWAAAGRDFTAPAETQGSFLAGEGRLAPGRVQPSYPRGVAAADLGALLGPPIAGALRAGLGAFARKLPGFGAKDALLTGVETRTSSPVRILRGENLQSPAVSGLYPCGEGAGYAGGIMSAAADGLRVANAIIEAYAPCE